MDIGEVRDLLGVTGEGVSHGLAAAAEDSTGSTGEESGEAGTASHGTVAAAEDSTGSTGEESGEAGTAHARCAPVDGDRADTVAGIHRTGSVEVDDTPMTQHDMGVRHVAPVAAGWFLHGPFQHLLVLT